MKIKKILKYNNKLVKLKLIQTKTYTKSQYLNLLKIEDIEYRLKKISHIIHKYNSLNKNILFVGIPLQVSSYIQKFTNNNNHIFFPTSAWVRGILSNKNFDLTRITKIQSMNKSQISKLILKIKKKVDLVVILEDTPTNNVLNESYISRKPTILLNTDLDIKNTKSDYKVPGQPKFKNNQIRDNLFYSLLISTLKKKQLNLNIKKNNQKRTTTYAKKKYKI